ncbi:MAG: VanZ family protein [Coriobacteriia bacterium]|nr:VanZ family protein [Coriobacteriia bacterium]
MMWMGVIFALSSVPATGLPTGYSGVAHFVEYAVLAGLLLWPIGRRHGVFHAAMLAAVIASAYAVTDEFHQSFVPGRTPQVGDWLLDTLGAATIVTLWFVTRRKAARRRPS